MKTNASKIIDVKKSPEELDTYMEDLHSINKHYRESLTLEKFRENIFAKDAIRNKMQMYKNSEGTCVGFCSVRVYKIKFDDKSHILVWPYAFIKPEYTGNSKVHWFGLIESLKCRCKYNYKHNVYFITPALIASYHVMAENIFYFYPSHKNKPLPSDIKKLILTFCENFDLKQAHVDNLFILEHLKFPFSMTDGTRKKWIKKSENNQNIKYYIEQTKLDLDKTVLVVAPVNLKNLFMSGCKISYTLINKKICMPLAQIFEKFKTRGKVTPSHNGKEHEDAMELNEAQENTSEIIEIKENNSSKNNTNNQDLRTTNTVFFKNVVSSSSHKTGIEATKYLKKLSN